MVSAACSHMANIGSQEGKAKKATASDRQHYAKPDQPPSATPVRLRATPPGHHNPGSTVEPSTQIAT